MTAETAEKKPDDIRAEAHEAGPVTRRVDVTVGVERVRHAYEHAYRDLAKNARVKGFRPGKVPRRVLEKMYGASLGEEIERTLVQATLADALELVSVEPVSTPSIDAATPRPDAEFTYAAIVEVKPAIELPELEGLPAQRPKVEVSDEDVERELEILRNRNAPVVEEPEGSAIETGHILSVDFVGRIDGQPFEGGSGRGVELEVGSGRFIPGFEEQLVGASSGDDVEVRVTFPEDYGSQELAGKEAVFDVHVEDVKRRQLPELDDEFAKDLGDFETLDALRDRIREDLTGMRDQNARSVLHRTVVDALIERTPFDVPPGMIDQQLERQLRSAVQRLQGMPEDQQRQQVERWRSEWRAPAEREVREMLLLEAVALERSLAPAESEVGQRLEELASREGVSVEQLREAVGEEAASALASRQLRDERALDFLSAAAKVEETTET